VPAGEPLLVAGDFNDWGAGLAPALGLAGLRGSPGQPVPTFPSRLPLVQLDYIYARGLQHRHSFAPHGPAWGRFSDHLPLIVDFGWPDGPTG
jgi:endonuclease/exonuclease/phosphatase family metal-dependent hydrolase